MDKSNLICSLLFVCICSCTQDRGIRNRSGKIIPEGFRPVEELTNASFRGISVVDSLVVWISGSRGTYMRTVDGGNSWKAESIPGYTAFDFRDVEAFDGNRAVLMASGRPAVILKTENGGMQWDLCYYNDRDGIFLNSMDFWNGQEGIAVGDPLDGRFHLIRTEDGGKTWNELPFEVRPEATEGEYLFAASGTCITVTDKDHVWFGTGGTTARIFFSRDRGSSWQVSSTPVISKTPSEGIFSVFFTDKRHGWAVGGDYALENGADRNAILTWDGGMSWQLVNVLPSGFRSCITQLTAGRAKIFLCTGPSGTDYSTDLGVTWIHLESPGYHTMDTGKDGVTVWAAGSAGRIAKLQYRRGNGKEK